MENLEGRLFAVQELKRDLYGLVGTSEIWDYLERLDEIRKAPALNAKRINKESNLFKADYKATSERIVGIISFLCKSESKVPNLASELFELDMNYYQPEEGEWPEEMRSEDFESAEEYNAFFFAKPDLITILYQRNSILPLDFELKSKYFFDIGEHFKLPGFVDTNELKRALFGTKREKGFESAKVTPYVLKTLTEIFNRAKNKGVKSDEEMGRSLIDYLSDMILNKSEIPEVKDSTINKAKEIILPYLYDGTDFGKEFSRRRFAKEERGMVGEAYANFLDVQDISERMRREGVEKKTGYQQRILSHFLKTLGETGMTYKEIVDEQDLFISETEEELRELKGSKISSFESAIKITKKNLEFYKFMRQILGREKNYVKKLLGEDPRT